MRLKILFLVFVLLSVLASISYAGTNYNALAIEEGFKGIGSANISDIATGISRGSIDPNNPDLKNWLYPNNKDLFKAISVGDEFIIYSDILPEPLHNYIAVKRVHGEIYSEGMWLPHHTANIFFSFIGTYTYTAAQGNTVTLLAFEKHVLKQKYNYNKDLKETSKKSGISEEKLNKYVEETYKCSKVSKSEIQKRVLDFFKSDKNKGNDELERALKKYSIPYNRDDLSNLEKSYFYYLEIAHKEHPGMCHIDLAGLT